MSTRMNWTTQTLIILASLLVLAFSTAFADCRCVDGDCYKDVEVSRAGISITNGTYEFIGMINDMPAFENQNGMLLSHRAMRWHIESDDEEYYESKLTSSVPPPSTGWSLAEWGDIPMPYVQGGEECGPPSLTHVWFRSLSPRQSFAKVGDTLRLEFSGSKQLASTPIVTIMGHTVVPTTHNGGQSWAAEYTPAQSDPEGVVGFTIDYTSLEGVAGPQVTESSDDWVYFDRTPPTAPALVSPADGATVATNNPVFDWSDASDGELGLMNYRWITSRGDEVGTSAGSSVSLEGLAEGTFTWYIVAVDWAGNETISDGPWTVTIDVPDGELVVTKEQGSYILLTEGEPCPRTLFTVSLSSAPTSNVTVTVAFDESLKTRDGAPGEDLMITFTPTSYGPVDVCLDAADDDVYRSLVEVEISITTSSDDADYQGDSDTVAVYVRDNDEPLVGVTAVPAGTTGGMLDISLPAGQDPFDVGHITMVAQCEVGESITGGCTLENALGIPMESSWIRARLWEMVAIPGGGFMTRGEFTQPIAYDPISGRYGFEFSTAGLDPGYYYVSVEIPVQGPWSDYGVEIIPAP